ncbi:hypothetical protein G7Y79_00003g009890 [Physcia stellaris]|nr:hypothetical protein G7Y79_00003g009890 [Physcia stellaris]
MPSKTLFLSSLLGMMTFFQGIIALPASSTMSPIPESATTFGEPVQATPSAAVELATTSNSTLSSLESDSNDSESHIVKRKKDKDVGWIQFYSNERCDNPPISDKILQESEYI